MAGLQDLLQKRQRAATILEQGAAADELSTQPAPRAAFGQATQVQQSPTAASVENQTRGFAPRMLEAGVEDLTGGMKNAFAATAQALGGDVLAGKVRHSATENAARAEQLSQDQVKDIRDVGPSNFGEYVAGQVLRGAPMIAGMGAGALGARTLGMKALTGAAGSSMALNTGETYGQGHEAIDAMKAAGQLTPERETELRGNVLRDSGIAGAINAALDTSALGYIFKANPMAKSAMSALLSKSLPGHMARSMLAEGGTEALQEYVGIAAQKHALEQPDMFGLGQEDVWRIANAGAAGATMGLPLAGLGHSSAKVGAGIDRGIDAAGKLVQGGQALVQKALPSTEGDSLGTKIGGLGAALFDTDAAKLKEIGSQFLNSVEEFPGFKQAMAQGKDAITAFSSGSKRAGRINAFVEENVPVVRAGFDAFVQSYGANVQTGNIEDAFGRYKTLLAQALGAEGMNGKTLEQMAAAGGKGLAARISALNAGLPEFESKTGAVFNTAVGVAQEAGKVVGDAATGIYEGLTDPTGAVPGDASTTRTLAQAGAKVVGQHAQAGVAAAGQALGTVAAEAKARARSYTAAPEEYEAARTDLPTAINEARRAEDPDGPKKTQVGVVMSPGEKLLAVELHNLAQDPKANPGRYNFVARAIGGLMDDGRRKYDEFFAGNEAARRMVTAAFDMGPAELYDHLVSAGERIDPDKPAADDAGAGPEATAQATPRAPEPDDIGAAENENVPDDSDFADMLEAAAQGRYTNDSPDPALARPSRMTNDLLDRMLHRKGGAATKGDNKGSTASVLIQKELPDEAGIYHPVGGPVAREINFMNVARAWAGERSFDGPKGETLKERNARNFYEGVTALLSGWHAGETDAEPEARFTVELAKRDSTPGGIGAVPHPVGMHDPDAKPGVKTDPRSGTPSERTWLKPGSETGNVGGTPRSFNELDPLAAATRDDEGTVKLPGGKPNDQASSLGNALDRYVRAASAKATWKQPGEMQRTAAATAREAVRALKGYFYEEQDAANAGQMKYPEAAEAAREMADRAIEFIENPTPLPVLDSIVNRMVRGDVKGPAREEILSRLNQAALDNDYSVLAQGKRASPEKILEMRGQLLAEKNPRPSVLSMQYVDAVLHMVRDEINTSLANEEGVVDVPASIALLPRQVRQDASASLLADLEALGSGKLKDMSISEQDNSFDNPNRTEADAYGDALNPQDQRTEAPISYAADEAAGKAHYGIGKKDAFNPLDARARRAQMQDERAAMKKLQFAEKDLADYKPVGKGSEAKRQDLVSRVNAARTAYDALRTKSEQPVTRGQDFAVDNAAYDAQVAGKPVPVNEALDAPLPQPRPSAQQEPGRGVKRDAVARENPANLPLKGAEKPSPWPAVKAGAPVERTLPEAGSQEVIGGPLRTKYGEPGTEYADALQKGAVPEKGTTVPEKGTPAIPAKPAPTSAQLRDAAMANLKDTFARAQTDTGRALLEQAMAHVLRDQAKRSPQVTDGMLRALAKTDLKSSTLQKILGRDFKAGERDRSAEQPSAARRIAPKKA